MKKKILMSVALVLLFGAGLALERTEAFDENQVPEAAPTQQASIQVRPYGGEIPGPFKLTNIRVELADGEKYYLEGRIQLVDERIRFQVDPLKTPWLANQHRIKTPYHLARESQGKLETVDPKIWDRLIDKTIRMGVVARGRVIWPPGQQGHYRMYLVPDVKTVEVIERAFLGDKAPKAGE